MNSIAAPPTWLARAVRALAPSLAERLWKAPPGLEAAKEAPAASILFDTDYYLGRQPDVALAGVDALDHYLHFGWREGRDPNVWFSTAGYLSAHPELVARGENPLSHLARRTKMSVTRLCAGKGEGEAPLLSSLIQLQPWFPTKWLNENYLAKGLAETDRARIQLNTYACLERLFPLKMLKSMLFEGRELWCHESEHGPIRITFRLAETQFNEGELGLYLWLKERLLYVFSFSIHPGFGVGRGERLLISRMQTACGELDAVKLVTKALGDVTPQAAVFAAAQGFARAVEVSAFMGVPADRQVAVPPQLVSRCEAGYDGFYITIGGDLGVDGFYHGPMETSLTPMSVVKAGHKIRTRHKRALKEAIRSSTAALLLGLRAEAAEPIRLAQAPRRRLGVPSAGGGIVS